MLVSNTEVTCFALIRASTCYPCYPTHGAGLRPHDSQSPNRDYGGNHDQQ